MKRWTKNKQEIQEETDVSVVNENMIFLDFEIKILICDLFFCSKYTFTFLVNFPLISSEFFF
jgi:hypothetical protein